MRQRFSGIGCFQCPITETPEDTAGHPEELFLVVHHQDHSARVRFAPDSFRFRPVLLGRSLRIGDRIPACSPNHRLRSLHACQSFGNGFICAMKIEPGKFPQSWA